MEAIVRHSKMACSTSALGQKRTFRSDAPCPLYPRKQTCAVHSLMSGLGQKRTSLSAGRPYLSPRLRDFSLCLEARGLPCALAASRQEMFNDIHPDCGGDGTCVLCGRNVHHRARERRDIRTELFGVQY